MFELIVASFAEHVVSVIVVACGAGGTAEEEGCAVLSCGEEHPALTDLVIGEVGRLMRVGVCVVALYPCGEEFGCRVMVVALEIDSFCGMFLKDFPQHMSVGGCCLSHVIGIFSFGHTFVLKNLAIYEERVLGEGEAHSLHGLAACSHVPEVVLLHSGCLVHRVGVYSDMLRCIVAESSDTKTKQVVDKFHVIFLEIGILRIHVRQSAHALQRALGAVLIVGDRGDSV